MIDDAQSPERDVIDLGSDGPPAAEAAPASSGADPDLPPGEIERITEDVIAALKTVHDPEIPADIYELGLIYQVDLEAEGVLKVEMTLTAPACPVTLTFDPPWTPDRMSEEARLMLNML